MKKSEAASSLGHSIRADDVSIWKHGLGKVTQRRGERGGAIENCADGGESAGRGDVDKILEHGRYEDESVYGVDGEEIEERCCVGWVGDVEIGGGEDVGCMDEG